MIHIALLTLLSLALPVAAQESLTLECSNIKGADLCSTEDNQDTFWDFIDDFKTQCDSFYGCGLGHNIIKW